MYYLISFFCFLYTFRGLYYIFIHYKWQRWVQKWRPKKKRCSFVSYCTRPSVVDTACHDSWVSVMHQHGATSSSLVLMSAVTGCRWGAGESPSCVKCCATASCCLCAAVASEACAGARDRANSPLSAPDINACSDPRAPWALSTPSSPGRLPAAHWRYQFTVFSRKM